MATIKESLLGSTQIVQLSQLWQTTFMKHAKKDADTGEYYMGEREFVEAIAPPTEDYVRVSTDTWDWR
jgi:solute carrier family 25 (mitochondrial aspartate/glutamate transporter), member 12/13